LIKEASMRRVFLALILIAAGSPAAVPAAHAGDFWDAYVRQYLQRLDGISPDAGDSEAVNTATHMIDPWPRYVGRRHIDSSGARMADVIERYRDIRKLPLAPPPIAPVAIGTTGFSSGGTSTSTSSSTTTGPAGQ
jgi:hypothetical protein